MRRLALVAALVAAACGDSSTRPNEPSATGTWTGNVTSVSAVLTLDLSENDHGVTGDGSFSVGTDSLFVSVQSGVHDHPDISMTLTANGFDDVLFDGTFTNDDTIDARLSGSGFMGETAVLTRS